MCVQTKEYYITTTRLSANATTDMETSTVKKVFVLLCNKSTHIPSAIETIPVGSTQNVTVAAGLASIINKSRIIILFEDT